VAGGDTELDRKIIERIGDSLIHLIRNSLDHGIESPPDRATAGKPLHGSISLSAFYDSGCVTIALADDGVGLSLEAIQKKALAKGLFDAETLDHFSRAEIINLIFLPGFSTSPIITDLSGRGVGMDVVRKNIVDDLKGSIVVESTEGQGTTVYMRLPMNLAVFSLCLFSVAGKTFALSTTSLSEMRTVNLADIIEVVNKHAIRLREQLVPIEDLAGIIDLHVDDAPGRETRMLLIVRDGNEKLGLIVDEILGQEEMVVKPLPNHLKNLPTVSGVTIGDDDAIIPILHVPELFRRSHNLTGSPVKSAADVQGQAASILVVDDSLNTREIEKSILEAYGYHIMTAEDGEEAWELTRSTLYDLVVTDVEMPRLDGFSLTERLRSDPRYRSVPIIIVTSREKDEDKKRGITVGADAYIVKGAFDQSKLLDTVRTLIG
jgi:chemotaxis protein histidine kinase CheA